MEVSGYCSTPQACIHECLRAKGCKGCSFNHIKILEDELKFLKKYYPVKVKVDG